MPSQVAPVAVALRGGSRAPSRQITMPMTVAARKHAFEDRAARVVRLNLDRRVFRAATVENFDFELPPRRVRRPAGQAAASSIMPATDPYPPIPPSTCSRGERRADEPKRRVDVLQWMCRNPIRHETHHSAKLTRYSELAPRHSTSPQTAPRGATAPARARSIPAAAVPSIAAA